MSISNYSARPNHRDILRSKGWTLRPAAAELGVHWTHLGKVLAGKRHSQSLIRRAASLPAK